MYHSNTMFFVNIMLFLNTVPLYYCVFWIWYHHGITMLCGHLLALLYIWTNYHTIVVFCMVSWYYHVFFGHTIVLPCLFGKGVVIPLFQTLKYIENTVVNKFGIILLYNKLLRYSHLMPLLKHGTTAVLL